MQMTLFFLSLPEFHCCYHRDVSERNEQFLLRKITHQTVRWWIMASDWQEHLSAGYLMEFWWSWWPNGAWERWKISWIIFLTACYISCKQQPWFVRNCVETIKYPFLGSIFFFCIWKCQNTTLKNCLLKVEVVNAVWGSPAEIPETSRKQLRKVRKCISL